ncbi:MAG: hypothetical protein Q9201_007357 [Fulgogasparrea decipioides]
MPKSNAEQRPAQVSGVSESSIKRRLVITAEWFYRVTGISADATLKAKTEAFVGSCCKNMLHAAVSILVIHICLFVMAYIPKETRYLMPLHLVLVVFDSGFNFMAKYFMPGWFLISLLALCIALAEAWVHARSLEKRYQEEARRLQAIQVYHTDEDSGPDEDASTTDSEADEATPEQPMANTNNVPADDVEGSETTQTYVASLVEQLRRQLP